RQLGVWWRKAELPGVSIRFTSCFFQAAWWSAALIVLLRRCSSGSVSNADEPSSTRPMRVAAPAANSRASATLVFPVPPCPTMATLRSFATSSAGIASSVPSVDDAEAVERQELVDGLDGGRVRRDQGGEAAGREHAGVAVLLLADAFHETVDQRRVAVRDARLDGVHRRAAEDLRGPRQLHAGQLRGAGDERIERDADAGHDHAAGVLSLRGDEVEGGGRAEVDNDRRARHALGGRDRVRDAIRPDLLRVVVEDRDASAHAGTHDERGLTEEPLAQLLDALVHRWHDA